MSKRDQEKTILQHTTKSLTTLLQRFHLKVEAQFKTDEDGDHISIGDNYVVSYEDREEVSGVAHHSIKRRKIIVYKEWYNPGNYHSPPDGGLDPVFECFGASDAVHWILLDIIQNEIEGELERMMDENCQLLDPQSDANCHREEEEGDGKR